MNTKLSSRPPRILAAALVGLALFSAACRSARTEEATVHGLVRNGLYTEAYELAERQAVAQPENADAQEIFARMRVVLILERGRRLLFDGQPTEALALFEDALALDPRNETVQSWSDKTKRQLAEEWLDIAQELASVSGFDEARAAFEKVLENEPTNATARDGLYRIIVRENYRLGLGRDYYTRGLDDLRKYELWAADRSLGLAEDYHPGHERATARRAEVREMLAAQRLAQADDLADKELFFAARNEYRLVLLIDPDNAAATAGLNRMDDEVRASQSLHEAEQNARRGDLDEALTLLQQGVKFTEMQADSFTLLESEVEEARLHAIYDEAISFYKDQRFLEAVAAFDRLLEATESFDDAISRRRTLQEFITTADQLYGEALEAEDPGEALSLLREIEVFWTEYRDIPERITALEKQVAEAAETETDG